MTLLNLAARVCRAFHEGSTPELRTVQKVKDQHSRDVVTELDMRLHALSAAFVAERLPGCTLLSEEGAHAGVELPALWAKECLIVDPLDGSSNHALGLPHFGYMAAQVRQGRVVGAVVVLPEHHQYLVMEAGQLLCAQALPADCASDRAPVYYAYPPRQDASARLARQDMLELIDARSSGLYRSGSACVGLYQLLCGRHKAFVGHGIRVWDALAFLPLLAARNIPVRYRIQGLAITVLASANEDFLQAAVDILAPQGGPLHPYISDQALKVQTP